MQRRKWKNSTEVEGRPLETQNRRQKKRKKRKFLTKAESTELSPQLSAHQEVSPRESTLAGLITEAVQEVQQKEKEVDTSSRKCVFAASAPRSLDPEGREEGGGWEVAQLNTRV